MDFVETFSGVFRKFLEEQERLKKEREFIGPVQPEPVDPGTPNFVGPVKTPVLPKVGETFKTEEEAYNKYPDLKINPVYGVPKQQFTQGVTTKSDIQAATQLRKDLYPLEKPISTIKNIARKADIVATDAFTTAETVGEAFSLMPRSTAVTILQAMQPNGASVVNRGWADEFIKSSEEKFTDFSNRIAETWGDKKVLPGIKLTDIAETARSMGYSAATMGAFLGTSPIAAIPLPGMRVAAWSAGTAASGTMAYNATKYQIMQQYLELKNDEMIQQRGMGLTIDEENKLKADFNSDAQKYALWEAVPEAISNLAFLNILTAPLSKIVGKNIAVNIVSKLAGMYGEEMLTETITQKGQAGIEAKRGMREGEPTWVEAFKEIAPHTFVLTTLMAGVGGATMSTATKIQKLTNSLNTELDTNDPMYKEIVQKIKSGEALEAPLNKSEYLQEREDTVNNTDLIQEARKYSTPEEFVEAQGKPIAQHKLIRDIKDLEGIKKEGFREGFNVNALPISKGGKPTNVIDMYYGAKKGDTIIVIPKNQIIETPNGYKVKKGFKPNSAQIIKVTEDYQDILSTYKQQLTEIWNKANASDLDTTQFLKEDQKKKLTKKEIANLKFFTPDYDENAINIKLRNIPTSEDAKSIIQLQAKVLESQGKIPQGERESLAQVKTDAKELIKDVRLNEKDVVRWAEESKDNKVKLAAAKMKLAENAQDIVNIAGRLQGDLENEEIKMELMSAVGKQQRLQSATMRLIAESGRALNANKKEAISGEADTIEKFIKQNLTENTQALIDQLMRTPIQELRSQVANMSKSTWWDSLMRYRQAALLSAPSTWQRNIIGNVAGAGIREIQKPFDILSDKLISVVSGKSERTWSELGSSFFTTKGKFMDFLRAMGENSFATYKGEDVKYNMNMIDKAGEKIFRFMEAQDRFFKKGFSDDTKTMAANRIATQEGLKGDKYKSRVKELKSNPTDEMLIEMANEALKWTYQTQPTSKLYGAAQAVRSIPVIGKIMLPFMRTVYNLGALAIPRTVIGQPVNLAMALTNKISPQEALSNLMLASSLQVLVGIMVETGYVTGGSDEPNKWKLLQQEGTPEYSLRIPGTDISFVYKNLEPISLILQSSVDLHTAIKDAIMPSESIERRGESALEKAFVNTIGVVGKSAMNFVDNSFLTGIQDFVDIISPKYGGAESAGRAAVRYGKRVMTSFIPRIVDWIDTQLTIGQSQNPETVLEFIFSQIPILSDGVPARIDMWGNPQRKNLVGDKTLNQILLALTPVQMLIEKNDPLNKELLRLQYYPSLPSPVIGKQRLSNMEYEKYAIMSGQISYKLLTQAIQSEEYKAYNEYEKQIFIQNTLQDIRYQSRLSLFPDIVLEEEVKKLTKKAQ